MSKPTPKSEVAINMVYPNSFIYFDATPDAARDFETFGEITKKGNRYTLWVDARFDFDEVLEYIKNYG